MTLPPMPCGLVIQASLGHIMAQDINVLKKTHSPDHPLAVVPFDDGFLISVWHDTDADGALKAVGHTEAFCHLVKMACHQEWWHSAEKENAAATAEPMWLQLDSQGPVIEWLPLFDNAS